MFRHFLHRSFLAWALAMVAMGSSPAQAKEVRVAVAANFAKCLQELAPLFTESTGHKVVPIVGSTGRHFAQISAGAPFDVFLAADERRPQLLMEKGLALASPSFNYARGQLVLWIAEPTNLTPTELHAILANEKLGKIAMANPRLAPYGEAARQTFANLGLPADLNGRIILGTSVGQTWQFAVTGNTDGALVALSQTHGITTGQVLIVPAELYEPVLQQAVLLSQTKNKLAAKQFLEFLRSETAVSVIQTHGYLIPEKED